MAYGCSQDQCRDKQSDAVEDGKDNASLRVLSASTPPPALRSLHSHAPLIKPRLEFLFPFYMIQTVYIIYILLFKII